MQTNSKLSDRITLTVLPNSNVWFQILIHVEDEGESGLNRESQLVSNSSVSSIVPSTVCRQTSQNKKARTQGPISKQNELLQKACSYLETSTNPDSNIPTIAKAWGEKLLTLDAKQRQFAEKAVNDVLFDASLGTLHRNSVKINEVCQCKSPLSTTQPETSRDSTSSFSTFNYSSPTYSSNQSQLLISTNPLQPLNNQQQDLSAATFFTTFTD